MNDNPKERLTDFTPMRDAYLSARSRVPEHLRKKEPWSSELLRLKKEMEDEEARRKIAKKNLAE